MIRHVTMEEFKPEYLSYYDKELTKWIMDKFGFNEIQAFQELIFSETYEILSDLNCGMWEYGIGDIFDMWVAEKITGNPRNVAFLRMGESK